MALALYSIADQGGPASFRDPSNLAEPITWVLHVAMFTVFVLFVGELAGAMAAPAAVRRWRLRALIGLGAALAAAAVTARLTSGAVWASPLSDLVWVVDAAMLVETNRRPSAGHRARDARLRGPRLAGADPTASPRRRCGGDQADLRPRASLRRRLGRSPLSRTLESAGTRRPSRGPRTEARIDADRSTVPVTPLVPARPDESPGRRPSNQRVDTLAAARHTHAAGARGRCGSPRRGECR
jgi:hypothetical protein